jgi:hypothetical protein
MLLPLLQPKQKPRLLKKRPKGRLPRQKPLILTKERMSLKLISKIQMTILTIAAAVTTMTRRTVVKMNWMSWQQRPEKQVPQAVVSGNVKYQMMNLLRRSWKGFLEMK